MYSVYVMTNPRNTTLYTGVTNDLERRVLEHKTNRNKGFTYKYNCENLVYFEEFSEVTAAIAREKQLKKYYRAWKEDLINKMNPDWKDLSDGWYSSEELYVAKKVNNE